jgi:cytidine deaminase
MAHTVGITQVEASVRRLLEAALHASLAAYNPYSHYRVGAAVETEAGPVFTGANMENASYGLTICAEPAAITAANTAGHRDVTHIAVVGGPAEHPDQGRPCTPCGRCRQCIWELVVDQGHDIQLYCSNLRLDTVLAVKASELLPFAWGFDPDAPVAG